MLLYIYKCVIVFLISISSFVFADEGWVSVPRPEHVVHQLEEEDRSVWVVFAKSFGSERVLVRFSEDPVYRHVEGRFEAIASHFGRGEMALIVNKKTIAASILQNAVYELHYHDHETGQWVFEKHVDTDEYQYILRMLHPSQSNALFRRFSDSFEVRKIGS